MMIWINTDKIDESIEMYQKKFYIMPENLNLHNTDDISEDITYKRKRVCDLCENRKSEIIKLLSYLSEKYNENERSIITENSEDYLVSVK